MLKNFCKKLIIFVSISIKRNNFFRNGAYDEKY